VHAGGMVRLRTLLAYGQAGTPVVPGWAGPAYWLVFFFRFFPFFYFNFFSRICFKFKIQRNTLVHERKKITNIVA
jgi:hypothetical protein